MTTFQPFNPHYGSGVTTSVGVTSTTVNIPPNTPTICITSKNAVLCYVRVGEGAVTATTADYPIPPNQQMTITRDPLHTVVAVIAPAGGGDLHIMAGTGF